MTNDEKVQHWINMSDRDIDTAEYLANGKRNLHAGYLCHQATEKILKAYFVKIKEETPPYTHNLFRLAELTGLFDMMSQEQKGFLIELNPLQIKARYQEYKDSVERELTDEVTLKILTKTKELLSWIKLKI